MSATKLTLDRAQEIRKFVLEGFAPHFGQVSERFPSRPEWRRLRELGTELWLDTGSLRDSGDLWTREFTALTTNNTLLNQEVQTGLYDALIARSADLLREQGPITEKDRVLEIAFILNAWHALRLVERFDAYVSVEVHTDLAGDVEATVDYARRYHKICPERFIVKVPFTPAGLLATRRLSAEGVPVNHTLGFSARQNYVVARLSRPAYVNVFLGRLNSFVASNGLGDGAYVGQRATLASQAAIRRLRTTKGTPSRQIGASFREPGQVRDLAGIDVMTMPPRIAAGYLDLMIPPGRIVNRSSARYRPTLAEGVDPRTFRVDTLWNLEPGLVACVDKLDIENPDAFTPDDLVSFFAEHGCGDVLVRWTDEQIATSAAEGKIPQIAHWREAMESGAIGLDSLMNLAGLSSFASDQKAMDDRVAGVIERAGEFRRVCPSE